MLQHKDIFKCFLYLREHCAGCKRLNINILPWPALKLYCARRGSIRMWKRLSLVWRQGTIGRWGRWHRLVWRQRAIRGQRRWHRLVWR